jgi:RimJ/RimL family protein N-acetyltransferase
LEDALLLLAWRNDPLTRAMSQTHDLIDLETHTAWLSRRLSQKEPGFYIVERARIAVGTIRIDGEEISYTVAPECRGQGLGTAMLTLAHTKFGAKQARIRRDNLASQRAAEKAGHIVVLID